MEKTMRAAVVLLGLLLVAQSGDAHWHFRPWHSFNWGPIRRYADLHSLYRPMIPFHLLDLDFDYPSTKPIDSSHTDDGQVPQLGGCGQRQLESQCGCGRTSSQPDEAINTMYLDELRRSAQEKEMEHQRQKEEAQRVEKEKKRLAEIEHQREAYRKWKQEEDEAKQRKIEEQKRLEEYQRQREKKLKELQEIEEQIKREKEKKYQEDEQIRQSEEAKRRELERQKKIEEEQRRMAERAKQIELEKQRKIAEEQRRKTEKAKQIELERQRKIQEQERLRQLREEEMERRRQEEEEEEDRREKQRRLQRQKRQYMSPIIELELKGYYPDDLDINVRNGKIIIKGHHICDCTEGCGEREFEKVYNLPYNVDPNSLEASLDDNGFLQIEGIKYHHAVRQNNVDVKVMGRNIAQKPPTTDCMHRSGIKLAKLDPQTGRLYEPEIFEFENDKINSRSYQFFDDDVSLEVVEENEI